MTELPFPDIPLSPGIRSRFVENINGLRMHVLEAGYETRGRPCVLLLHGFPELAYSWRKVMPALAAAGYHVIAPHCRLGRRPRGRSRLVPADQSGARRAWPRVGVRLSLGCFSGRT
jgi:pimeloyl-ACP methyl ester carboxylesterase